MGFSVPDFSAIPYDVSMKITLVAESGSAGQCQSCHQHFFARKGFVVRLAPPALNVSLCSVCVEAFTAFVNQVV